MSIRQGCTPVLTIELFNADDTPFDTSLIDDIVVTFSQYDENIVEKYMSDLGIEDNRVEIYLTQEDTLSFTTDTFVEIQPKILLTSGQVVAPDVVKRSVSRILNKVVFK